ncbi:hypothetical protein ACFL5Z_01225 [Planctomycetota bacterium]
MARESSQKTVTVPHKPYNLMVNEQRINSCIYCKSTEDLCKSAHIIPRLFGKFKNQPTLKDSVCKSCDKEFGRCAEQLAKCGPEALFRYNLGLKGRHRRKSSSPFQRKHSGHGPIQIKVTIPYTNHQALVEPIGDGHNCRLLPQVIVIGKSGENDCVLLDNAKELTVDELRNLIYSANVSKPVQIRYVMLTDSEVDHIDSLLKKAKLHVSDEFDDNVKPFNRIVSAAGTLTYDKRYYRAIAKVAFHYYIEFNNFNHTGEEPFFEPLKRFIRYGEGQTKSFVCQQKGILIKDIERGWRPPTYGHIIVGSCASQFIEVKIQFFLGPQYDPPIHTVKLGRKPLMIENTSMTFGHNYVYADDSAAISGYDGTFHRLAVTERIIIP